MNRVIWIALAAATLFAGSVPQTFTGVITDSMCVGNHAMMRITPDPKCVAECVRSGKYQYVLWDGQYVFKLSDQQTPARFAGKKVKVTGTLFPRTGVIRVDKIGE